MKDNKYQEVREEIVKKFILKDIDPMYTGESWEQLKLRFPFRTMQTEELVDWFLSLPSIAVVDRDTELPENPIDDIYPYTREACKEAQQDMLQAGYVKEIKKEKK